MPLTIAVMRSKVDTTPSIAEEALTEFTFAIFSRAEKSPGFSLFRKTETPEREHILETMEMNDEGTEEEERKE